MLDKKKAALTRMLSRYEIDENLEVINKRTGVKLKNFDVTNKRTGVKLSVSMWDTETKKTFKYTKEELKEYLGEKHYWCVICGCYSNDTWCGFCKSKLSLIRRDIEYVRQGISEISVEQKKYKNN